MTDIVARLRRYYPSNPEKENDLYRTIREAADEIERLTDLLPRMMISEAHIRGPTIDRQLRDDAGRWEVDDWRLRTETRRADRLSNEGANSPIIERLAGDLSAA